MRTERERALSCPSAQLFSALGSICLWTERGPDPCLRKAFGIRFGSVGKTSELQCLRGLILQASTMFSSYLEMLCSEALSRLQHEQYTSRGMGSEVTSSVLLWKSSIAKDGPLHLKL
jgi:hypothetical protein